MDSIGPETVDGVFRIGSGEDHQGGSQKATHKIKTIKVGHIDVDKDGVNHILLEIGASLSCRGTRCHEFEIGNALDIGCELLKCKRLVVDG